MKRCKCGEWVKDLDRKCQKCGAENKSPWADGLGCKGRTVKGVGSWITACPICGEEDGPGHRAHCHRN